MDISWPMTYLESGTKDFPNPFNKEVVSEINTYGKKSSANQTIQKEIVKNNSKHLVSKLTHSRKG